MPLPDESKSSGVSSLIKKFQAIEEQERVEAQRSKPRSSLGAGGSSPLSRNAPLPNTSPSVALVKEGAPQAEHLANQEKIRDRSDENVPKEEDRASPTSDVPKNVHPAAHGVSQSQEDDGNAAPRSTSSLVTAQVEKPAGMADGPEEAQANDIHPSGPSSVSEKSRRKSRPSDLPLEERARKISLGASSRAGAGFMAPTASSVARASSVKSTSPTTPTKMKASGGPSATASNSGSKASTPIKNASSVGALPRSSSSASNGASRSNTPAPGSAVRSSAARKRVESNASANTSDRGTPSKSPPVRTRKLSPTSSASPSIASRSKTPVDQTPPRSKTPSNMSNSSSRKLVGKSTPAPASAGTARSRSSSVGTPTKSNSSSRKDDGLSSVKGKVSAKSPTLTRKKSIGSTRLGADPVPPVPSLPTKEGDAHRCAFAHAAQTVPGVDREDESDSQARVEEAPEKAGIGSSQVEQQQKEEPDRGQEVVEGTQVSASVGLRANDEASRTSLLDDQGLSSITHPTDWDVPDGSASREDVEISTETREIEVGKNHSNPDQSDSLIANSLGLIADPDRVGSMDEARVLPTTAAV
ncbi:hypothetical protein IE53DRAFT_365760 [Violaceomyces palustris]|uniref:Uncharacterized protein n=1 Tax=Violaceomyces palustris TaxID=1673888 RepID=A0ACD0P7Q3_9BASI|nr:hypothetical protein IE53DRAFT_365760 [Violaceomyces palustris]